MVNYSEKPRIGGTIVWYYCICKRQVWLMCHGIEPEPEDEYLKFGRIIDARSYAREKHQVSLGDSTFDFIHERDGQIVISEVKKSSRSLEAAKMQVAHYLYELMQNGITAKGEVRVPLEKKIEPVELNAQKITELESMYEEIQQIATSLTPPSAREGKYCRHCAYAEMCWS